MSVSDKLITEEIGQAISLLEGVLNRLQAMTQPAPVAEPTPQIAPGTVITLEDVRAVLTKVSGKHGAAAVKELLAPHKKLSDVPHTQWAALIDKAEQAND